MLKTVRIWFEKTGTARYISHLDLNRCMARALRRAKIPAWYTEGFNPHLFLTFALPLSLGQEGLAETMDIKLSDETDISMLPQRLNAVLPAGLRATKAALPEQKPGAIAFSDYELLFETPRAVTGQVAEQIKALLDAPQILVMKRTKTGERELDLKPRLGAVQITGGEEGVLLQITLPSGSTENINPALLADYLLERMAAQYPVKIVRLCSYDGEMKKFA